MTILYGIANCDTVRKARKWLATHDVDYRFHDFRKEGINTEQLTLWCQQVGWERLLNRRGTTWRQLPPTAKKVLHESAAVQLMLKQPAMIKRPVLDHHAQIHVGFNEDEYQQLFLLTV